ncbi:MAG: iron export ABC transporter permease subunit FetB [Deltaproteobacteria bacterium]|nr:iron export ABC transporter permease subunit FetB [Deltaproteobacteria bacterium]
MAGALVLIAIAVSRAFRLGLELDYVWASARTVAQLLLVGHVLLWIFDRRELIWVLLAFGVMLGAASVTAARRGKRKLPGLLTSSAFAMTVGCGITVVVVTVFVVRADPWWTPRYFLPLAGMIVGNSMNAAALTAERLVSEAAGRQLEIEELLALGATPRQASAGVVRVSIRAGMIPMINSMLTVGLVSIPGMMTGQMIAGADPSGAARYQIVVMFMLAASTTMCAVILGGLLYRRLYNSRWQLRRDLLREVD